MSNIWHTPLCVCLCLFVLSWWCCLRAGHLIVSWFLTAQGYILGWLGDVTSTLSFCQHSRGVCYQQIYVHNLHVLYWPIRHMTVWGYCIFVLSLIDILSMFFLLHSVYKSHPLWNQYTDSTELYSLATSYSLISVDWIFYFIACWIWSAMNTDLYFV